MSLRTRRYLALLVTGMLVVAACEAAPPATPPPGTPPPATPTPAPATPTPVGETPAPATPTPPPAPTPTPVAVEQELVYPTDGQMTYLNNGATDVPTAQVTAWIHEGLYQYNDALEPVPAIADGMPEISEDGLVWTVRMKTNAVFMPGEIPVTADDVVFTYEMSMNPNCQFNPSVCLSNVTLPHPETGEATPVMASVEALDSHTVQFTMNFTYAPMLTVVLPAHGIESRQATEASFARFETGAVAVTPEEVADLLARVEEEEDDTVLRADLEELLQRAGLTLPEFATFPDEGAYVAALIADLRRFQTAQQAEAADAIAAAYRLLDISTRQPVSAGPFYVTEFLPGQSLTLTANPNYHEGAPQLSRVIVPIITDAVAAATALEAGAVDWVFSIESDQYHQIRPNRDVKIAEYADFAYFGIQFNLHEEHDPPLLFTDRNLRQAVEYCFDKEAAVEVATAGQGIPIWADIPPASWAYNPNVPTYPYDPAEGRRLIEESGWVMGGDGVYEHPELNRRLETHFPLRAGRPDRTLYVSLVVDSLNTECGFNITYAEYDFGTQLIPMLINYPHNNPGEPGVPFEAYFGGWGTGIDPDPFALWHSSQCSSAEQPDSFNYICFQNERADEVIEAQVQELDFEARRALLWEFEEILATELPYSFAWSPIGRQGLRVTVNQSDAEWTEAFMSSPTWAWELHKITNIR